MLAKSCSRRRVSSFGSGIQPGHIISHEAQDCQSKAVYPPAKFRLALNGKVGRSWSRCGFETGKETEVESRLAI